MDLKEFPHLASDVFEKAKRLWSTYKWASHLAHFEDINLVSEPIFRCRNFAVLAWALAILTSSILLLSLNLNVLDTSHGSLGYHGVDQIAQGIAEEWASAMPRVRLNSLTPTKQTVAAGVAFVLSLLSFVLLAFLGVWRRSARVSRRQQLVFSCFIVSLGLLRYSVVTIPVTVLVWIAREQGFDPSSDVLLSFGVLLFTYVTSGAWTQLANRHGRRLGTSGSRDDDMSLFYSSFAPIVFSLALLCAAAWTGDRFKPSVMLQTSDACGAPDNGICVLYIRPRDVDGTISLDRVGVTMLVVFDEDKNFVGPEYVTAATASFRVIESPDEPFPVRVGPEATRGVVGYSEFHCPFRKNLRKGHVPKIRVLSYSASAIPKTNSDADPGRREPIPITFEWAGDVPLLFRNIAKECSLFP
ncbi:hypothetical protein PQQ86_00085 [Paraburkholderia sediminicola]|uniref:hypothetical protein n=1 Tax=Paraburkholderia TaxID=1822464 RepID=UPI0038B9AA78